jgi:DNA-binding NtrC family response regulator
LHEIAEFSHPQQGLLEQLTRIGGILNQKTPFDAFVLRYARSRLRIGKPTDGDKKLVFVRPHATDLFSPKRFGALPWREMDKLWVPCNGFPEPLGLYVIFTKPKILEADKQFVLVLDKLLQEFVRGTTENSAPMKPTEHVGYGLVGRSDALARVCDQIRRAATHLAATLIEGATGTGKELVARAIHDESSRHNRRFVAVDCGAIPDGLFESEMFGVRRGSFTGSHADRVGLAEEAHNGTLFLDEISNLSLQSQAKLLRFLQQKTIRRLGDSCERTLDVRILAATNIPLDQLVANGKFREDLYFRLNTVHIHIPPLSSRRADLVPLAQHFLTLLNTLHDTDRAFSAEALREIYSRNFPGNVRELKSLVERCYYSSDTRILEIPATEQTSALRPPETWFTEVFTRGNTFWSSVYIDYRQRRISREELRALIDYGLRATNGYYRALAQRLNILSSEYRKFMDFLRRNDCLLDFRPYRRS